MTPSDDSMEPSPAASTVAYKDIALSIRVQSVIKYSDDPDIDFRTLLKVFNEHAVRLAQAELQHGTSPEIRRLAEQVIANRKAETPGAGGTPADSAR